MKCNHCGSEYEDHKPYCPQCGYSNSKTETYEYAQENVEATSNEDKGGFGWGLLGCCVPVAGLVLYLVWKESKPNTAKAIGIGALVSVILSMALYMGSCTLGVFGALL